MAPPSAGSRHQRAKELLAYFEDELDRWRRERDLAEGRGNRSRVRKLNARMERIEEASTPLFRVVHPPLIGDVIGGGTGEYRTAEAKCRSCDDWFAREEVFDRMGFCESCWSVATGKAAPSGEWPDEYRQAVVDLLGERFGE